MAERDVCSRQSARCAVRHWKAWLVPPAPLSKWFEYLAAKNRLTLGYAGQQ